MKRGFLNTARARREIPEVHAPEPPPKPKGSSLCDSQRSDSNGKAARVDSTEGAMDANLTSDAGNHTTGSTEGEARLPSCDDDNPGARILLEDKGPNEKGKGKVADTMDELVDDHTDSTIPSRPLPQRRGWGRHPNEEVFHTVPQAFGGRFRKRAVFRAWPCNPNGQTLRLNQNQGKLSPDGYPWGETLYDLFAVERAPGLVSFATGSALLEAVKETGELDAAEPEIEWAMTEGKPRILGVADTAELIYSREFALRMMNLGIRVEDRADYDEDGKVALEHSDEEVPRSEMGDSTDDDMEQSDEDQEDDEDDNRTGDDCGEDGEDRGSEGSEDHGEDSEDSDKDGSDEKCNSEVEHNSTKIGSDSVPPQPAMSIPKSFAPFKSPRSILLQEHLPLYLLPQKLYVHDPFSLLAAQEREFDDESWTSRPDIIQTYNLELSESVRKEGEEARRKAQELEEFKARTLIILRYKRTKEQIENHEPVVEIPLPRYPRRLTQVKESHLYISPVAKIGDGNHSIVYRAEWELPRDLFVRPKLCPLCFQHSVDQEIQQQKDAGIWDKALKAVGWGPTGATGYRLKQELDEIDGPHNLENAGEIIREITCHVPPNVHPMSVFETVDESPIWDKLMNDRDADTAQLDFGEAEDDVAESATDPPCPIIRVHVPVAYDNQMICTHDPWINFSIPPTAKFTVVAKLSLEDDPHLAREAKNYEEFPEHFFHHYNGYTIIKELHTLVPVGAVVPQFYGYYTPSSSDGENTGQHSSYLSPILLLEHCGKPMDPKTLSMEDQQECASLVLRFQRAGWLHESVAPRNFLVQLGKPTEFPSTRRCRPERSFRLIDFGRSRRYTNPWEKRQEEMELLGMLEKLGWSMNITLS